MSHTITLKIRVPDEVDPTRTDPWEVASEVVDTHAEWAERNGLDAVMLEEAEWDA